RRITFRRTRIGDAVFVERLRLPSWAADLVHSGRSAELLGELGKHTVPLLQNHIVLTLSCAPIDANSTPAHLMHQGRQVTFKEVGGARTLLVEDGVQAL